MEKEFDFKKDEVSIDFGNEKDIDMLPEDPKIDKEPIIDQSGIELKPTKFNYENLRDEVSKEESKILLAKEDDKIIGFVAFTTEKHKEPNFIKLMWVHPKRRSEGIADKLITETLENIPSEEISLDLWGKEKAQKFFEKYGFQQNPGGLHTNRFTLKRKSSE